MQSNGFIQSLKGRLTFLLILFCCLTIKPTFSQKVGVVLSGGGATGLAHIGVLKALEEAEIPIDYIVGTSSGALIAALYVSGYSPEEIEQYVLSKEFNKLISGNPSKEERFYLREKSLDASMMNFHITLDSLLYKSLATNYLTPSYLDFEMLRMLGVAGASVNKDFDSLFLPFRCVASDVYNKRSVVLKNGDLNAAVRASITFPFFINPIRVDNQLMFDGGLYNNFPSDVLYHEFPVDYIIGSNVSANDPPPAERDIISQITTLFTYKSSFELPCNDGLIIEPEIDIGTFEFYKVQPAIRSGYEATIKQIDTIRTYVHKRKTREEIEEQRTAFRKRMVPISISNVHVSSRNSKDVSFVRDNMLKDTLKESLAYKEFSRRYFRAYASPQIKYMFPRIDLQEDSTYLLDLEVEKQKPISVRFGGLFSTRPTNIGYIGVSYSDLGKGALGVHGETYFGKFYTSAKLNIDYDLPTLFPLRVSPYVVLNRWDYLRSSSSTFFGQIDPSFLLQNELFYGLTFGFSNQQNGKFNVDLRQFKLKDQYYQLDNYVEGDTADITNFQGESAFFRYEMNTLNRKQWASRGTKVKFIARYIQGKENSLSGSLAPTEYDMRKRHQWMNISAEGQHFFDITSFFRVGVFGQIVYNSNSLFSNYSASILTTSEFAPLPIISTLYLEKFRAPQFMGGGVDLIFAHRNLFEFRISPYFFQPIKQIIKKADNDFGYSEFFREGTPLIGSALIYHSPIGPLSLSANYFHNQSKPFVIELSFGYALFNERAIR